MRGLVSRARLEHAVEVHSAGTSSYHVGEAPDPRACAAARERGVALGGRARQFRKEDFRRFDYVLAMDSDNLDALRRGCPDPAYLDKIRLLRSFDPAAPPDAAVPDPYYGGERGFFEVLEICEAACAGLLEHLRRKHRV
jgi:protein-tyrosine phosphatase